MNFTPADISMGLLISRLTSLEKFQIYRKRYLVELKQ